MLLPRSAEETLCPVRAVRAWREAANLIEGTLFRHVDRHGKVRGGVTSQTIALVVKRAAGAAGLDAKVFAGQSLRSGWITTAHRAGRTEHAGMGHTRHKSERVYSGYIQRIAKWEDHPGLGLL